MLAFFVVTYLVAWGFFFVGSMTPAAWPRGLLFLLGTFAPGYVALWLTSRETARGGVAALLRRLLVWQVPARWYAFAVGYIAVVKLTVALVHRAATGAWPRFGQVPWYLMLAATVGSTVVGGQAGEEIGWRGYALPRLAARFGLGGASVLLGLLWACWHLPLFFISGTTTTGQSFPVYLLQVTALSVAMAWLYAHTRGSLLPVMLMHAAVNNTKDIVPSAEPNATNPWALSHSLVAWMTVALLWLCAGYFLLRMRKTPQLSREVVMRLLAIAFLLAVAPSASASPAINANDVLLSAMSPFEDMIEFALAGKDSDISKALVATDQHATGVKKALSASAASEFATLMEGLHRAATDKDHHEVARSAVEVFRLLSDNLQAKDLKVPKEVSLLDYAGFKLRVLAATQKPDWQDIRKTVGEAAGWWKAINPKVSEQGLRNAFDSVIRGLDEAVRLENLPMLRFAAQIDLDLVDLLEGDLTPKRS